ncbi:hypothetical protein IV498_16665 [Paenarthrobacter sp. Z7-10]|uniref:hypothetical protein n=1 Tax=Paenarthrobacter sp. Z7-10 TaxID=2787635 RepID=UPI0022A98442|nr:hypothetical protein [Paenarthrobacter sp. Z7-10]MCZ2404764.1 hypothetical protein [Paenarthrobacter sp. Z7-10]
MLPTPDDGSAILPANLIVVGQAVAHRIPGDIALEPDEVQSGHPAFLYHGHPGHITDPTPQHILVDWAGLEESPWSYAYGISVPILGGPCDGLTAISEAEFRRRAQRLADGLAPTPDENDLEN